VKKKEFLSCYPCPLSPPKHSYLKHKHLKKKFLVRSPGLAYVVRMSQAKLEPGECKILGDTTMNILPTLVQLSNRREFILVRSVFILRDT